jgi:hypothetical protein
MLGLPTRRVSLGNFDDETTAVPKLDIAVRAKVPSFLNCRVVSLAVNHLRTTNLPLAAKEINAVLHGPPHRHVLPTDQDSTLSVNYVQANIGHS